MKIRFRQLIWFDWGMLKMRSIILTVSLLVLVLSSNTAYGQQVSRDVDLSTVEISMKTNADHCFGGHCPVYLVTINGDGTVTYEGFMMVKVKEKQSYTISFEKVKWLVDEFMKADFFSLKDSYTYKELDDGMREYIDHAYGVTTTIRIGDKSKSVYSFYGTPKVVEELHRRVIEVSDIDRFIKGEH